MKNQFNQENWRKQKLMNLNELKKNNNTKIGGKKTQHSNMFGFKLNMFGFKEYHFLLQ